jgi:hypothetical protein
MLRTLVWYLKRPALYPDLIRNARRQLGTWRDPAAARRARWASAQEAREAARWCDEVAVDVPTAMRKITGSEWALPFDERFAAEVAAANDRQAACPVAMGGAANLDLLYYLAEHTRAVRAIETGVAYGWSSLAVLLSLAQRDGQLISTDRPYAGTDSGRFVGCIVPARLHRHWCILQRADREALPQAIEQLGSIDFFVSGPRERGSTLTKYAGVLVKT